MARVNTGMMKSTKKRYVSLQPASSINDALADIERRANNVRDNHPYEAKGIEMRVAEIRTILGNLLDLSTS